LDPTFFLATVGLFWGYRPCFEVVFVMIIAFGSVLKVFAGLNLGFELGF
jgi:hypothetical protein